MHILYLEQTALHENIGHHDVKFREPKDENLNRWNSPSAGSYTYYYREFFAIGDVKAGEELFLNYGDSWAENRPDYGILSYEDYMTLIYLLERMMELLRDLPENDKMMLVSSDEGVEIEVEEENIVGNSAATTASDYDAAVHMNADIEIEEEDDEFDLTGIDEKNDMEDDFDDEEEDENESNEKLHEMPSLLHNDIINFDTVTVLIEKLFLLHQGNVTTKTGITAEPEEEILKNCSKYASNILKKLGEDRSSITIGKFCR